MALTASKGCPTWDSYLTRIFRLSFVYTTFFRWITMAPLPTYVEACIWGRFFVHFLSAENSAEFLGKTIFQNFFRGKFNFFPTFLGENFPRNFPRNFARKKCTKNRPWWKRKLTWKCQGITSTNDHNLKHRFRVCGIITCALVAWDCVIVSTFHRGELDLKGREIESLRGICM
jgi:hypothetical protein